MCCESVYDIWKQRFVSEKIKLVYVNAWLSWYFEF